MLCPVVRSCYRHFKSGKSTIQVVGGGSSERKQKLPESWGCGKEEQVLIWDWSRGPVCWNGWLPDTGTLPETGLREHWVKIRTLSDEPFPCGIHTPHQPSYRWSGRGVSGLCPFFPSILCWREFLFCMFNTVTKVLRSCEFCFPAERRTLCYLVFLCYPFALDFVVVLFL